MEFNVIGLLMGQLAEFEHGKTCLPGMIVSHLIR